MPHFPMVLRRLVFLVGCLVAVVAGATAVSAHSTLVEATPDQGERVASLDEIVLRFGDPIIDDGASTMLALQTPDGTDITIGPPEHVDAFTLRATVPHTPEPGSYVLRYQVLSYDGDLNDGGHLFDFDPDAAANANAPIVLLSIGGAAVIATVALLRPRRRDRASGGSATSPDHGAVI
jgi:methionine-rich copper-binding protein CopC